MKMISSVFHCHGQVLGKRQRADGRKAVHAGRAKQNTASIRLYATGILSGSLNSKICSKKTIYNINGRLRRPPDVLPFLGGKHEK